ncbi:MAG: diguanylate cyclase [Planctomycetota bacterium]
MEIKAIMSRNVITAGPDDTVVDLCRRMNDHNIGSVVIVDGRKPIGIFTERDAVRAAAMYAGEFGQVRARDVMRAPVETLPPQADIHEAMELMRHNRIRRLPVTEEGGLVGIVTLGDILKVVRKELADSHSEVTHLRGQVDMDTLTGVYNRRFFNRMFKREVERVKRHGGFLSLLMVDLDNFKPINDTHGHDAGDQVLTQVASMIVLNVREINMVCRFGGDEFAVIAPISDLVGAVRMGERLRAVLETLIVFYKGLELQLTISVGVATWSDHMENVQGLLMAADQALYEAKKSGRNRVCQAETAPPQ